LLFRFSALTFNAHLIHLDKQYAREVEGYRNTLVHGPLSLVLMLSVLGTQLRSGEYIRSFHYKNLASLYVNESLKICVKSSGVTGVTLETGLRIIDVWIEGKDGLAVKGTAVAAVVEQSDREINKCECPNFDIFSRLNASV
jgi:hydroxyacyl-ACP dehydratase HTD2-like protein with hotdog domain